MFLYLPNDKGSITPRGQVKIYGKIYKHLLNNLPWLDKIRVLCNKTHKDVHVNINRCIIDKLPPLPNSTSSNNNLTSVTNTSMKNLTLEQGTLLSDTLSLTPLINASLMMTFSGISGTNKSQMQARKFNNSKLLNETNDNSVKIVRIGNDAHIKFPTVNLGSSSNVELTLGNPTKGYVRWKSFFNWSSFYSSKRYI
jgi:hypothetical protein